MGCSIIAVGLFPYTQSYYPTQVHSHPTIMRVWGIYHSDVSWGLNVMSFTELYIV